MSSASGMEPPGTVRAGAPDRVLGRFSPSHPAGGAPARPVHLQSRWCEVEGRRLHSRSAEGPGGAPFVLLHGLVISSLYMVPLAEKLAGTHDVHALDFPGFGRSAAPARALGMEALAESVVGWLGTQGMQSCHVVANSMGCQVAAHLAVRHAARVLTLTLVGPTIDPLAHRLGGQVFRLCRDAVQEPARIWVTWAFDFLRAGLPRAVSTTRLMFEDRIERLLPAIAAPTLVLRGQFDPTVPARWAREAAGLLPKGQVREIAGAPHCAHFTHAPEVAAAILEFTGSASAARL